MAASWSMGPGTLEVPLSLFAKNRKRLAEKLKPGQVVVLQGGESIPHYDTDIEYVFRQEAYFTWVCGVREQGCFFALDVSTSKSYLFIPRLPEEYEVWMGKLHACEDFKRMYAVDEVHYVDEIQKVLKGLNPDVLLTLSGPNTDSGLTAKEAVFEGIDEFEVNNEILFPIIAELRVVKTPEEIEVMRYVVKVSSDAHKQVMLFAKPGLMEYQCESIFLDHCYRVGGCRHVSYTCICGSGHNAATLHYGHAGAPNSKLIQPGDMCLFDMGGNYAGYAADITCSFPASGKFTADQKLVYEAVLAARDAVVEAAKPGVLWPDMHLTANRAMLEHLKKGGLLKGDVEDMIKELDISATAIELFNEEGSKENANSSDLGTVFNLVPADVQATRVIPLQSEHHQNTLRSLLEENLETTGLLSCEGLTLSGDSARNLLAAAIAKRILQENKNLSIRGEIYYKWCAEIRKLFPGERTTTYYIPSCKTANGAVHQARGKLVSQVLNTRKRFQRHGVLTTQAKRGRESSPATSTHSCPSPRPLPEIFSHNSTDDQDAAVEEDLIWLQHSSDPWYLVEEKWKRTCETRIRNIHSESGPTIEKYIETYRALKSTLGYSLAGINGILQPHGLGHLLGLDVHDVGGYLPACPPRPSGPLARLRTSRVLLANMLLTIEPGCYFIPRLLDSAKNNPEQSEFFNWDVVERFHGFGGVRIEDDVLITDTGVENLTFVPRTVAEIEDFMANGANFK